VVFDLDGVLYLGDQVVPAAPRAVEGVRKLGLRVGFVTNNAVRSAPTVADKLSRLGVRATAEEVLTSADAVVRLLGGHDGLAGKRVLALGGPGLLGALEAAGARLLDPREWRAADLVVVGLDPELTYDKVRGATLAIAAGARFVGSNADANLPTPEGPWPGAGSVLALLETATGVRPAVAGKPEPAIFEAAAARLGTAPLLMVGDRDDTDLAGAKRLGWDVALVLSGATRPERLLDLPEAPDHLLADVGGLLEPPGPLIRPAAGDAEAAAARALLGPGAFQPPRGPGRRDAGELLLVAVERRHDGDARVVGAVACRQQPAAGRGGCQDGAGGQGEALLAGVVVEAGRRGALIGTRLLLAAALALRARGVTALVARCGQDQEARVAAGSKGSEAGVRFLTRLGFAPRGDGALLRALRPAARPRPGAEPEPDVDGQGQA
jgi:HAD superfamily hydrolase (TIGR01450 family)